MSRELRRRKETYNFAELDEEDLRHARIHAYHSKRKDILVIKFRDDDYTLLIHTEKAISSSQWKPLESGSYDINLSINVKATRKMDSHQRFYPAYVREITQDMDRANQAMQELDLGKRTKKANNSSPTKRTKQIAFLDKLAKDGKTKSGMAKTCSNLLEGNDDEGDITGRGRRRSDNRGPKICATVDDDRETDSLRTGSYHGCNQTRRRSRSAESTNMRLRGLQKKHVKRYRDEPSLGFTFEQPSKAYLNRIKFPSSTVGPSYKGIPRTNASIHAVKASKINATRLSPYRDRFGVYFDVLLTSFREECVEYFLDGKGNGIRAETHRNDEIDFLHSSKLAAFPEVQNVSNIPNLITVLRTTIPETTSAHKRDRSDGTVFSHGSAQGLDEPEHRGGGWKGNRSSANASFNSHSSCGSTYQSVKHSQDDGQPLRGGRNIRKVARTPQQIQLLKEIKRSLSINGTDKAELFPGSKRYLPHSRLINFKAHLHLRNPLMDAVNLALLVFGSSEAALTLFCGDHFGLKAALGQDILSDLLSFINGNHPGITSGKCSFVYEDQLVKGFSRKLYYLRHSNGVNADSTKPKEPTPEHTDTD